MRLIAVPIVLFTLTALAAQDQKPKPSKKTEWKILGEFGIGAADSAVVSTGIENMLEFIAAGVEDGEDEHWTNQSFMTEETLAAVPLRFRFLRDAAQTGRMRESPFLIFDYEKEIAFEEMFANMDAQAMDGEEMWLVRGMRMCSVKRPNGGYRLNFGGRNIFGAGAANEPLFTTYTEITTEAGNKRLMTRLRQMPIHASMDFRKLLGDREGKELIGLFGPRAGLVAGSITTLGKRPVLDLYSAMRAGDGLVGGYMSKKSGHARVLGSLNFEPHAILAADLGKQVPRTLLTLANGARQGSDMKDVLEPLIGLLEVWTGEITLVATGVAPPAKLDRDIDLDDVFKRLGKSLEFTILFGVEEDAAADIVESLETFLGSDAIKRSEFGIEAIEDNGRRAFRMAGKPAETIGVKHLSFGAGNRLVAISFASTAATCLDRRDGALAKQGSVRTPKRLGLAQGPVKIWVQHDLLRYVGAWLRLVRGFAVGESVKNRADWVLKKLENELLGENLAVSLSWASRTGTMLRMFF